MRPIFAMPAILLIAVLLIPSVVSAASCESLASTALPHATITAAEIVAAGAFRLTAPPPGGRGPQFGNAPSFCRVAATLKPTSDSDIKIEVWLPTSGWNGKFQPSGNGCFGGAINYGAMANHIRTGSATAGTNGGHDSDAGCAAGAGAFVFGHPEKLKDFAERSFHEMTVDAKTLISAYYGNGPKLSFLDECGGGSRQALTEIQRFPDDYDAVAAGGLDGHSTHHVLGQLWVWQATHKDEASYIPPAKYPIIHRAAVEVCDARDGVKDGVISDPTRCKFDPGILECKGGDAASCLTAPQVEAARKIYTAPANPRTKQHLFGPLLPGSELGWAAQAGPLPFGYGADFFRYLVFKDPNWDPKTRPINFDSDATAADAAENLVLNANNPDISKFIDRGGKLFIMGGWADTGIAPFSNTEYYEAMVAKMGAKKMKDAVRFYMVPDMGHCPGTVGASAYAVDTFHIIQDWKEKGQAPDQLIMTHYVNGKEDRKVLVCQYPQIGTYKGSGDINDPANYSCKAR